MRSLLRPFNFHRPKKVLLLLALTLVLIFVYQLYRWNRALSSSLQGGPRLSPHHQEAYDHAIFNREGQTKQSQGKEGRTRFLLPNRSNFFIPGVPPADRELYRLAFETGEGTFACLRSKERLDVNLVNDDYCDCADGSDEPSTSACSHLPHSRFFCSAACGQTSHMSVPASRVNDGICDCCDGSDEVRILDQSKNVFHYHLEKYIQVKGMKSRLQACFPLKGPSRIYHSMGTG